MPDEAFLIENPNATECECCENKIRRRYLDWKTIELYDFLVPKFGITVPLYFSFLKLHILLLIIVGVIFGVFFSYNSQHICSNIEEVKTSITTHFNIDPNILTNVTLDCTEISFYMFVPQDAFLMYMQSKGRHFEILYYSLAVVVFIIIVITPFIHEIAMRMK